MTSEDLEIFHDVCERMEREKSCCFTATVVAVLGLERGLFDSQDVQTRIDSTQLLMTFMEAQIRQWSETAQICMEMTFDACSAGEHIDVLLN